MLLAAAQADPTPGMVIWGALKIVIDVSLNVAYLAEIKVLTRFLPGSWQVH